MKKCLMLYWDVESIPSLPYFPVENFQSYRWIVACGSSVSDMHLYLYSDLKKVILDIRKNLYYLIV